jgi:hypothetical protein
MSIEAMKQALDFISRLKFPDAEPEPEVVMAILDKAIAEAEKQEPDKYVMDIECTKCGAQQSGILTVNTTSQQRKPLTDDEIAEVAERMEASDPTDSFWRDFARAIEAAHDIKE